MTILIVFYQRFVNPNQLKMINRLRAAHRGCSPSPTVRKVPLTIKAVEVDILCPNRRSTSSCRGIDDAVRSRRMNSLNQSDAASTTIPPLPDRVLPQWQATFRFGAQAVTRCSA